MEQGNVVRNDIIQQHRSAHLLSYDYDSTTYYSNITCHCQTLFNILQQRTTQHSRFLTQLQYHNASSTRSPHYSTR